jgi:hypothetical protein
MFEEDLGRNELRNILAIIASSVGHLAKDTHRTYANKKAPFADVPLVFTGENVTRFLKEIEQRSAFHQWSIRDRIKQLLSHYNHIKREVIKSSITEFIITKEASN